MSTPQEQARQHEPIPDTAVPMGHDGEMRERSVGSLFGELVGETSALVRGEITLARKEMHENLSTVQRGVAAMAAGGAVLAAGLLALVAAAILILDLVMPAWLAALIVGAVVATVGAIMLVAGKRKTLQEGLKPERTLSSLQDMTQLARHERDQAMRKWR